jgi:hypothetical protein
MGREDSPTEMQRILRASPAVLLGGAGQIPGFPTPQQDETRHVLRIVLGDVASEPITSGDGWNGAWEAPPGRRCSRGVVHDIATTFETCVVATPTTCKTLDCNGTVGGCGYWSQRTKCSKCRADHAAEGDTLTVYETCHACGSTPVYLGALRSAQPTTALPLSTSVYASVITAKHPTWTLRPSPPFPAAHHTFLALFAIAEGGRLYHADGRRRVLGVTADARVVLGVKTGADKPYLWTAVEHWFRDPMQAWFVRQHAPLVAMLPQPQVLQPSGVLSWALPCCSSTAPCHRKKCRTQTDAPWLHLRQLKAHGKLS